MPRKIENFVPGKPFIYDKKTYIFAFFWFRSDDEKLLMYRDTNDENNVLCIYEDSTIKELFE